MRIVLGLGNPGRRYAQTRHNVGFRTVDRLAAELGARFRALDEDEAVAGVARASGEEIVIAKPVTMMNRSGEAARRLASRFGAAPSELVVVYDDVALALGKVRVRASGRSAGQKGMESIIRAMGTTEIPRVRLGILGNRGEADLAEYVLEPFLPEERQAAEEMVDLGARAVLSLLEKGIPATMNAFNRCGTGPG